MLTGIDIAMLTFSCVAANHLGLVGAIEEVLKRNIPIVNCPKCFTFWVILFTTCFSGWNMVAALAVSFLSAYASLWLQLIFTFIDKLFDKLYDKIHPTAPPATDHT